MHGVRYTRDVLRRRYLIAAGHHRYSSGVSTSCNEKRGILLVQFTRTGILSHQN